MFFKCLKALQMVILLPIEAIWVLAYYLSSQKSKIDMDIERFAKIQRRSVVGYRRLLVLVLNLMWVPEFRRLFLFRIGGMSMILSHLMGHGISIGLDVPREKLGGGLYLQHAFGSVLSAKSVGENCWINQLVTVGYKGNGCPTIGNNVRIGTGAIIIGDIKIGDNVNIGAGAIVLHDVPDNCTVCCPEATIVKRHDPPVEG
jgi:serine O-acetyltransferase